MYHVISSDGIKIAVEDINNTSNKVIVMIHGWPISKEMFEYQKNILVENGYRVVSFDIRGFGDSEVSSDNYNYNQLATDLKYIIDTLNVDKINLLGFSMGGAICVRYMSLFNNDKIAKLILAGAAVPSFSISKNNPYGNTLESTNNLISQAYYDRPKMVNDFGNNVFALSHSEAFKKWFRNLCFKGFGIGTIKTAISLRDEDLFNDLSKINVPTLIMHGRLDKVCSYDFTKIMNNEINNSKIITFDYSGHGLFYDELYKFNNELLKFLEE